MALEADVFQGDHLVAQIERTPEGSRLQFLPEAASLAAGSPGFLAWHLPYTARPIEQLGDNLHPFFWNLLPEGARLSLLFQNSRLARDDFLGMLLKVGWDTVGDVAVVSHGEQPRRRAATYSRRLSEVSFWDAFYEGAGANPDAAVPGVQEKISAATVAFPVKGIGAPVQILKLNPRSYPQLVQNEMFFLRMARGCGLEVNRARIVHDRHGEPGLLVDRFDRIQSRKGIQKLHQEDACQLLNTSPANKYHVSFRDVMEAVREASSAPVVEGFRLLVLYAFSYLIGNGDLHAKNVSVLWKGDVSQLSPAYDLLSTLPYPGLDQGMALKLDGKDKNFKARDFIRFGQRYGLSEQVIRSRLNALCKAASPWLDRLGEIGFEEKVTLSLRRTLAARLESLGS